MQWFFNSFPRSRVGMERALAMCDLISWDMRSHAGAWEQGKKLKTNSSVAYWNYSLPCFSRLSLSRSPSVPKPPFGFA